MKIIFEKQYDSESLFDLTRDMYEAINPEYNEKINEIPTDEHGFQLGTFTVTITWSE